MNDRIKLIDYFASILPGDYPTDYFLGGENTNYAKLYRAISEGFVKCDQDALKYLFDNVDKSSYFSTKSRLLSKFIAMFAGLYIQGSSKSGIRALKHRCNQVKAVADLLIMSDRRHLATGIIRHQHGLLARSENACMTETYVWTLHQVGIGYALEGDRVNTEKIHVKLRRFSRIYILELESSEALNEAHLALTNSLNSNSEVLDVVSRSATIAAANYAEAVHIAPEYGNFNTFQMYYHCQKLTYELRGEFEAIRSLVNEFHSFLESHSLFKTPELIGSLLLTKSNLYYRLAIFDEGYKYAKGGMTQYSNKGSMWIRCLQNYILNCMHNGEYTRIVDELEQLDKLNSTGEYKLPEGATREYFIMFKVVIALMRRIDLVDFRYDFGRSTDAVDNSQCSFNLATSLKYHAKDKDGYYSQLMQIKIILLLEQLYSTKQLSETLDDQLYNLCSIAASKVESLSSSLSTFRTAVTLEFLTKLKDGIESGDQLESFLIEYSDKLRQVTSARPAKRDAVEYLPCELVFSIVKQLYSKHAKSNLHGREYK